MIPPHQFVHFHLKHVRYVKLGLRNLVLDKPEQMVQKKFFFLDHDFAKDNDFSNTRVFLRVLVCKHSDSFGRLRRNKVSRMKRNFVDRVNRQVKHCYECSSLCGRF